MEKLFTLPDLGEGLTESEILSWKVAVGETVELNQVIAEVETAKAVVELPSPFSGVVTKIFESVGAVVNVGSPIISFEVTAPATTGAAASRQPTLVGYGAAVESGGRPVRRGRATAAATGTSMHSPVHLVREPAAEAANEPVASPAGNLSEPAQGPGIGYLRARPPVRKLARDLHIDLQRVHPTGPGGLITREDVQRATGEGLAIVREASAVPETAAAPVSTETGRETRVRVHGLRKETAKAVVASAFTAPHVTEFLSVDVTNTMELLASLRGAPQFAGVKLTITTLVAKAVSLLLARHQGLNSRWNEETGEIVEFHYVNLGVAAATDRGLLVPVLREAQTLSLEAMARGIAELTEGARAGTLQPAQLTGGTFSITNIGVFGIDAGTPILPPGQTGILGLGQVRKLPWEFRDEVALRQVVTLSLSFDHRVVDGAGGAAFLTDLAMVLREPGALIAVL